ncbi:MAG TPA: TIGR03000 domain-containing protein [Urbifossiella sp.]|nr:TIGR03000 domain-containing protein [Urbifossiella sp.]
MYSIVLMAATATGPTVPAADHTPVVVAPAAVGCCGGSVVAGCTGCTGYVASCYGSCYGSRVSVFHRHKSSCYGCGGGYSYGCCGGWSCFGSSYGCGGSCYGSYSYGGAPAYYGTYSYGGVGACYGNYSYHYGCGGSTFVPPQVVIPQMAVPVAPAAAPTTPMTPPVQPKSGTGKDTEGKDGKDGTDGKGASLRFQLPPTAVLYVDGQRAAGEGAERAFYTPPLQAGQRYFYDVKAEVMVNGQMVTEEKRVIVTAGAELIESFPRLLAAVTDPTTVAGR